MKKTLTEYIQSLPKVDRKIDDSAMCAVKWINTHVNFGLNVVKSCCTVPNKEISESELETLGKEVFSNHPYELERRKEKLNNIKHSDCETCWKVEKQNIRSIRLPKPFYDLHKSRFNEANDSLTPLPTQLELYFSNICDLKCIYCSNEYSSQWEIEDKKFGVPVVKKIKVKKLEETFWKWYEEDAADKLLQYYVLGGEPLIQNDFYDFLDKMIPILVNKPNVFNAMPELIVVTNGHAPEIYLERWLQKVKELENIMTIQMNISMDCFGKRAEYIRSNLNWDRFSKNVEKLVANAKEYNIKIRLSLTHSMFSITSFLDLLKWVKELKDKNGIEIEIIQSTVSGRDYISPWILTKEFDTYVDEAISWISETAPEWNYYIDFINNIKNSFGNHTQDDLKKFLIWEKEMKRRRNVNFLDIFPEMESWYEYCCNSAQSIGTNYVEN